MITIKDLFILGKYILEEHGILEPDIDARYLLLNCLDISSSQYYLRMNEYVDERKEKLYMETINKRSTHYPLQYILGKQEFMGLDFFVNEDVLVPRQDTEILVEKALNEIDNIVNLCKDNTEKSCINVLDMCTGSGCIAISIERIFSEKHYKNIDIFVSAADISKKALNIAQKNVLINNARVNLIESNLFDNIQDKYDIIVSNPPYIKSEDIEGLMEEVRVFEPKLALDGDKDGLFFYRKIIKEAFLYMNQGSELMFEIGCDQAEDVISILMESGFQNIEVIKDLAGLDRVVKAEL